LLCSFSAALWFCRQEIFLADIQSQRDITVRLRNWCSEGQSGNPTGISVAACPTLSGNPSTTDPDLALSCYYLWRWREACPCACTSNDADAVSGMVKFRITGRGAVTSQFDADSNCLSDAKAINSTGSFHYQGTSLRMTSTRIESLYSSASPGANSTFSFDQPGDDVLSSYVCKVSTPVQTGVYDWKLMAWGLTSPDKVAYTTETSVQSGFKPELNTSTNSSLT
jgi:hypothetical protein